MIFVSEMIIKILAFGPSAYFKVGMNGFDFFIVVFSLVDLGYYFMNSFLKFWKFRSLQIFAYFKDIACA